MQYNSYHRQEMDNPEIFILVLALYFQMHEHKFVSDTQTS